MKDYRGIILWSSLITIFSLSTSATEFACKNEALFEAERLSYEQEASIYDESCFVLPETISERNKIVDVRTAKQYGAFHLLNSINIPANILPSKHYLRGENIVLVGEPFERFTLSKLCGHLKKSGFHSVSVALGGVESLSHQGFQTNRSLNTDDQYLVPRQLVVEWSQGQLTLAVPEKIDLIDIGVFQDNVDLILDMDDSKKSTSDLIAHSSRTRYPLVVLGREKDYEKIRRWFGSGLPGNLYFVEGGVKSFTRYLSENKKVQLALAAIPNRYRCL